LIYKRSKANALDDTVDVKLSRNIIHYHDGSITAPALSYL
jgi:hypothetical protein